MDQVQAAACICAAHAIATASSHMVFVTHNDFQAVDRNDTVGLVPRWTGENLSMSAACMPIWSVLQEHAACLVDGWKGLACAAGRVLNSTQRMDSATFAAYASSRPGRWATRADHHCCRVHQLGCPAPKGAPPSDAAALARIGQMLGNKTLSAR